MKVDIVTSDDIKIYYTEKFKDFTARYIINLVYSLALWVYIIQIGGVETFSLCYI